MSGYEFMLTGLALYRRITRWRAHQRRQVLLAALCANAAPTPRRPKRARTLMDWRKRVESLTHHEFVERYRVDLQGFQEIVEKIRPFMPKEAKHVTAQIPLEVHLSATLRWCAGGVYQDQVDIHGLGRSTFFAVLKQVLRAVDLAYTLPLRGFLDDWNVAALSEIEAAEAQRESARRQTSPQACARDFRANLPNLLC